MKAFPTISAAALGVLILTVAAGGWQSVRLAREHGALKAELGALRGTVAPSQVGGGEKKLAEITHALAEIDRESTLLASAQAKLAEAEKAVPALKGQELRSLGRIEEFGRNASQFIEQAVAYGKRMSEPAAKKLSDEETNWMISEMTPWLEKVEVVGAMEDDPQEIARLHAATIAERLKLDAGTAARVKEQIAREFSELAAAGLVRSKRPDGEGREDWQKRRSEVVRAGVARVEALIPEGQRAPWVVEQSMQLGNSLRSGGNVGPDGHGSVNVGISLPGTQLPSF